MWNGTESGIAGNGPGRELSWVRELSEILKIVKKEFGDKSMKDQGNI